MPDITEKPSTSLKNPDSTRLSPLTYANVLLIGCGPHAKRVYVPAIKNLEKRNIAKLCAVVELEEAKNLTRDYFGTDKVKQLYVERTPSEYELAAETSKALDKIVAEEGINAVIIATEPLAHMQYALWATKNKLHILMDKPISTHTNVANDLTQATKIAHDFKLLQELRDPSKAFIINAQRRYHPGFQLVRDRIAEIAQRFAIPITNMQTTHCDGQWRLPEEIITQAYHPYNSGYGKVSHSGYHLIDILSSYTDTSYSKSRKNFDKYGVFTSFIKPTGLLDQQRRSDYLKVFGDKYNKVSNHSDEQLRTAFKNFGEVDSTSLITLYKNNEPICNISLNLMHNGFARRSWILPGQDLYKGNGRVKHEYHNIEQGPYQNIQIHSYQSKDKHDVNTADDYKVGGNNHFDIYIYRNSDVVGGKPLEIITAEELKGKTDFEGKLITETVKHNVVNEFIEIVLGTRQVKDTESDLSTHGLSATLMSLIYQSGNQRKEIFQEYAA